MKTITANIRLNISDEYENKLQALVQHFNKFECDGSSFDEIIMKTESCLLSMLSSIGGQGYRVINQTYNKQTNSYDILFSKDILFKLKLTRQTSDINKIIIGFNINNQFVKTLMEAKNIIYSSIY